MQGEKDWEKYEVARKLKTCVDDIRYQYNQDLKSKQMSTRQRAVALYFIDKVCLFVLIPVSCSELMLTSKWHYNPTHLYKVLYFYITTF